MLVIILLQLARQGNYTFSGFLAYMWLYYYIGKQHQETIDISSIESDTTISHPTIQHDFKTITN